MVERRKRDPSGLSYRCLKTEKKGLTTINDYADNEIFIREFGWLVGWGWLRLVSWIVDSVGWLVGWWVGWWVIWVVGGVW